MDNQDQNRRRTDQENITKISVDIEYIKRDVGEIKKSLQDDYVTRDEFQPVRNIVYGLVTSILLTVLGAILALVVTK